MSCHVFQTWGTVFFSCITISLTSPFLPSAIIAWTPISESRPMTEPPAFQTSDWLIDGEGSLLISWKGGHVSTGLLLSSWSKEGGFSQQNRILYQVHRAPEHEKGKDTLCGETAAGSFVGKQACSLTASRSSACWYIWTLLQYLLSY